MTVIAEPMNTTKQAAEKLGISQETVKKYCQQGYLNCKKFGHLWTISDREIEKRLEKTKEYYEQTN